jgi:zinc-finger binding domain of transposase IS66/Transposase C of IS166 homeodomain
MDDVRVVNKEDLGSAHTRAREVHGEVLTGPERRRRWALVGKTRYSDRATRADARGFGRERSGGTAPAAQRVPDQPHRERRQPIRRPLPDHLPREEIVHDPGSVCPGCGGTRFSKLGEDVTEVLEKIPARLKVYNICLCESHRFKIADTRSQSCGASRIARQQCKYVWAFFPAAAPISSLFSCAM